MALNAKVLAEGHARARLEWALELLGKTIE